jgi:hypothetical protein
LKAATERTDTGSTNKEQEIETGNDRLKVTAYLFGTISVLSVADVNVANVNVADVNGRCAICDLNIE